MKNKLCALFLAFVFVFSLSVNAFGEGDIPIGGKTCGIAGQPPCPVAAPIDSDTSIIKSVLDILIQIFD